MSGEEDRTDSLLKDSDCLVDRDEYLIRMMTSSYSRVGMPVGLGGGSAVG